MAVAHTPKSAGATRTKGTFIQQSRSLGAEEKAIFHNVTGAGRSGIIRRFMDLNEDDQDFLTEKVAEGIDRLLAGER